MMSAGTNCTGFFEGCKNKSAWKKVGNIIWSLYAYQLLSYHVITRDPVFVDDTRTVSPGSNVLSQPDVHRRRWSMESSQEHTHTHTHTRWRHRFIQLQRWKSHRPCISLLTNLTFGLLSKASVRYTACTTTPNFCSSPRVAIPPRPTLVPLQNGPTRQVSGYVD